MKRFFGSALVIGLLSTAGLARAEEDAAEPTPDGSPEPLQLMRLGELEVNLEAQLQLQGALVGSESQLANGDPADASGFRIKRARLGVSGNIIETIEYSLIFSFVDQEKWGGRDMDQAALEDLDSVLHEAVIGWQPLDEIGLVAGSGKLPFSRGQLDSSASLLLIERPRSVEEMAPDRRLGLALTGGFWDKRIQYTGGIFNSTPGFFRGENSGGLSLDGGNCGDEADEDEQCFAGLVAGRLEFHPLGVMPESQSDFQRSDPLLRVGADVFWDSAPASEELAVSADLGFQWMGISLLGEFLWMKREPSSTIMKDTDYTTSIERNGWYVQLGYMLDPEWLGGYRLELAFRFEQYDDNHAAEYQDEGDQRLITGGLNAHFLDGHMKLQVNYIHRQQLHGKAVEDDALVGLVQWRL